MYMLMSYQTAKLTECLITYFTNIRALTTMYAFMFYQSILVSERFITHITNIRALMTVHTLMSYQIALLTECRITNCTGIRALTTMQASMSCKTSPFTECLITHFTWIWMLTTMYFRGISAFSSVCMLLFIQSTLVKTQMLNIRIYSDRKNYFYSNVYIKLKSNAFEELCYLKDCY